MYKKFSLISAATLITMNLTCENVKASNCTHVLEAYCKGRYPGAGSADPAYACVLHGWTHYAPVNFIPHPGQQYGVGTIVNGKCLNGGIPQAPIHNLTVYCIGTRVFVAPLDITSCTSQAF